MSHTNFLEKKNNYLKLFLLNFMLYTISISTFSQNLNLNVGAETGTVDSGLPIPLTESYSKNNNSEVENSDGRFIANELHSITALYAPSWAREGNYVLKFHADGSNYPNHDYAYRAELSNSNPNIGFSPNEERYYSLSFFPPKTMWDEETKYSTIITQWKQYGGGQPNMQVKLSNMGDYKLTVKSNRHWESEQSEGDLIGYAKPDEWNDLKYYVKHSQGNNGVFKIWLNGELVFTYNGPNLYKNENGYTKFGMYTEIRDERIIYFDAVNITDKISVPVDVWAKDQAHLPKITLTSPLNSENFPTKALVCLNATAADPAGNKIGSEGKIKFVEFFANDISIGIDKDAPYNLHWTPEDGAYDIKAITVDEDNHYTTSSIHSIQVGSKVPEVEITSPSHLTNYDTPHTITITADANDEDDYISKVEFFVDNTSIGIDTTRPYSIDWTSTKTGAFIISAQSTNMENKKSERDTLGITIGASFNTTTLTATDDATINENQPDLNGNWTNVEIRGKENVTVIGLFKFNIKDIINKPEIRSAKLKLYTNSLEDNVNLSLFEAYGDSWKESSITWNSKPSKGAKVAETTINSVGKYFEFDITKYIKGKHSNADKLVSVWIEDSEFSESRVKFDSRTKTNPPRLEIITSDIGGADIIEKIEPSEDRDDVFSQRVSFISPSHLSSLFLGDSVTLSAGASDPYGNLQKVSFHHGSTLIGDVSTSPYSLKYLPKDSGNDTLIVNGIYKDEILSDTLILSFFHSEDNNTIDFTAVDDATIREDTLCLNGNWDNNAILGKKNQNCVMLLKFDISLLMSAPQIKDAKLCLFTSALNSEIDLSTYSVKSNDWFEESVTWETNPKKTNLINTQTINDLNQYNTIDITSFINKKIQSQDSIVSFWLEDSKVSQNEVKIQSRLLQNPPLLSILIDHDDPLPVELIDFSVEKHLTFNTLKWITASELNSDYFQIQVSENNKNWTILGNVKGQGTSHIRTNYEFRDYDSSKNFEGNLYYRLLQFDLDGKSAVYGPIQVNNFSGTDEFSIKILNNPISSNSVLCIHNLKSDKLQISIFNTKGKLISLKSLKSNERDIKVSMAYLNRFPKGIYILKVKSGNSVASKRILIQ
ncbi:CBM96 family carbohydrate-binding protein [Flammeovirga aprica]|uniref:DNRLRE domain-containing protein n=1 Tax=Flammeovirga aprica JL-4 TaxID=694437 RepID=A0A7X9P0L0_9BACT|nr:Ig-like domain-containing protein [Flammeovirga aprica]NME66802.1 DNRLRE domain-containing protein [Flammeovirga aprica JL-4]